MSESYLVVSDSLRPHSPPGSSVHGVLQTRILEWIDMPSSRGSSQSRDQTRVSRIGGKCFTIQATREETVIRLLKTKNKKSQNIRNNDMLPIKEHWLKWQQISHLKPQRSCWKWHFTSKGKKNVKANHILNFIHSSQNLETLQILFNGWMVK